MLDEVFSLTYHSEGAISWEAVMGMDRVERAFCGKRLKEQLAREKQQIQRQMQRKRK